MNWRTNESWQKKNCLKNVFSKIFYLIFHKSISHVWNNDRVFEKFENSPIFICRMHKLRVCIHYDMWKCESHIGKKSYRDFFSHFLGCTMVIFQKKFFFCTQQKCTPVNRFWIYEFVFSTVFFYYIARQKR